jgi:hypothetical protein
MAAVSQPGVPATSGKPAVAGGLLRPAVPALRSSASHRCPDKDWMIFGGDEAFDWNGDKATVRPVDSTWAWRSLGTDPAGPNTCLRTGVTGVTYRLVGWFNTDKFEFPESPEQPMLAMLQGQTTDATVRYFARQRTGFGAGTVFATQWHLRGRESFALSGRAYDTLVFDLSETNIRNANIAHDRLLVAGFRLCRSGENVNDKLDTSDLAEQQAIAGQIQAQAFVSLPFVPLGQ